MQRYGYKIKVLKFTMLYVDRAIKFDCPFVVWDEIHFNPRSYVRSDNKLLIDISILFNFNPRSYVRSDIFAVLSVRLSLIFQSTLLREERLEAAVIFLSSIKFQSTLLREERPMKILIKNMK